MKPAYKSILFSILIIAAVCTLFWRVFANEIPIPYRRDYIRFLTQQVRIIEDIQAGYFPLWNPYMLCGMPTISNVMTNLFSPFLPLYFLLSDPLTTYVFIMLLELCMIGWSFMYMMQVCFKIDRLSSFISAVVFMLCGYSVWLLNVSMRSMFEDPLFLFPLAVALYFKLRQQPSFIRCLLLACVLAISYLNCNGNILHFGYNVVFIFVMNFFFMIQFNDQWQRKITTTLFLILAVVVSLLLTSFQLFPFLEALSNSTRFTGEVLYSPPKPFPIAISFIYPDIWPKFIFINKIGGFYGLKYGVFGYCGVPSLILALIGAMYHTNRNRWFFIIVPLSYLVLWPIYTNDSVQSILPMFLKSGNHFYYSSYLYAFCIAILAGLGFHFIKTHLSNIKKVMRLRKLPYMIVLFVGCSLFLLYLVATTGIAVSSLFTTSLKPIITSKLMAILNAAEGFSRSDNFYHEKINFILTTFKDNSFLFLLSHMVKISGLLCLAWILISPLRKKHFILIILAGCIVLDMIATNYQYLEFLPHNDYYQRTPEINYLENKMESDIFRVGVIFEDSNWFWRHYPEGTFREFHKYSFDLKDSLQENIITRFGIQKIGGFDGMCPYRQHTFFRHLNQIEGFGSHGIFLSVFDSQLLDLCNMEYILTPASIENPKFKEAFTGSRYTIYQNTAAVPRAYWVPEAEFIENEETLFNRLSGEKFNYMEKILIAGAPPKNIHLHDNHVISDNQSLNNEVKITKYTPNSISLCTNTNKAGWLVLTDAFYPGWKAYIDSKETDIYPANYLFRAIYLQPGNKTVTFNYFSEFMRAGLWTTGCSILLITVILILTRFRPVRIRENDYL